MTRPRSAKFAAKEGIASLSTANGESVTDQFFAGGHEEYAPAPLNRSPVLRSDSLARGSGSCDVRHDHRLPWSAGRRVRSLPCPTADARTLLTSHLPATHNPTTLSCPSTLPGRLRPRCIFTSAPSHSPPPQPAPPSPVAKPCRRQRSTLR